MRALLTLTLIVLAVFALAPPAAAFKGYRCTYETCKFYTVSVRGVNVYWKWCDSSLGWRDWPYYTWRGFLTKKALLAKYPRRHLNQRCTGNPPSPTTFPPTERP